ncbi:MAG: hypothetical protein E7041_02165 [Lentisphaerae bacterium]|nr:hypothetical protein [Lentisphaerota bacterium]
MLTRKKIFFLSFTIPAAVRALFGWIFGTSMFKHFHLVRGLDMETLLRFSEWGSGADAIPLLTPHRLLLFINWFCHGKTHVTAPVFIIQALLGALGCAALADLVLTLTGKRRGALAAGIIAALYLPSLVYEFSILQDSFAMNFTLLAIWGTSYAWRKNFRIFPAAVSAVLWSLALCGRPTAAVCAAAFALWSIFRMYRKKLLHRLIFPAVLLLTLLVAASLFNYHHGWKFSPFYSSMQYAKTFNATPRSPQATELQVAKNALIRSPQLLSAYELRENQNIYFWQRQLPELRILPAPSELIPAACAALMILLVSGAWKRKSFYFVAIPLLTLALPLCFREVIGRYRLLLTPYFIVAVVMAFYALKKLRQFKLAAALLTGMIAAGLSIYSAAGKPQVIAEDLHAWAMAAKNSGTEKKTVFDLYYRYWQHTGFTSAKAFRDFAECTLELHDPQAALTVCRTAMRHNIDPHLVNYYYGMTMVMQNRPEEVAMIYSRINPGRLPPDLRENYFRICRDTRKILLHKRKN